MPSLFQRIACIVLVATSPALAHDRHGNAAMHQDVHVLIAKDHVEVTFQIETNEEGTFVEAIAMDANGDGKLSPEEQSGYFAQLDARLREGLQIRIDQTDVLLRSSEGVELTPPARKIFRFHGALPATVPHDGVMSVFNDNFPAWPGKTALKVEAESGAVIEFFSTSSIHSLGLLTISGAKPGPIVTFVSWSPWSWQNTLISPIGIVLVIALLTALILLVVFRQKFSRIDFGIASGLITVSFLSALLWLLARNPNNASEHGWSSEFRLFHERLIRELESFHQGSGTDKLPSLCTQNSLAKLQGATRVVGTGDERSGTFDLHRLRDISTTILKRPRSLLDPTLRVHHEWRAIGLMRHHGHPHERSRDFACDYTLRVTDHGFVLLDCSDWHQLPDEPIE